MGASISKIFRRTPLRNVRVLMLGLDNAGKTTILNCLKDDNKVEIIPTVGFNLKRLTYKKYTINVWDVGGQENIRPLWQHYYRGSDALIFVVDASDEARIEEARAELHQTVNDVTLRQTTFLIFANKSDMPAALGMQRIAEKLNLHVFHDRQWALFCSCATTGHGLSQGLDWLVDRLDEMMDPKKAAAAADASAAASAAALCHAPQQPVLSMAEIKGLKYVDAKSLARFPQSMPATSPSAESFTQESQTQSQVPSQSQSGASTEAGSTAEDAAQPALESKRIQRANPNDPHAHRISLLLAQSYSGTSHRRKSTQKLLDDADTSSATKLRSVSAADTETCNNDGDSAACSSPQKSKEELNNINVYDSRNIELPLSPI